MIGNKRKISAISIYFIVAFVYVLSFIIIPFNKPTGSWLMFVFSIISLAFGACISLYAFGKKETLISKFYGYPVFRIGVIYTVSQVAFSIILFVVGAFVNVPYWVGLLISILLLGLASIGVIATDNARDFVENIDLEEKSSTRTITTFQNDISDILDWCKDESVREQLQKLVTKFKYSDPVSNEATIENEKKLNEEITKLREIIKKADSVESLKQIEIVNNLLNSRNRVCESNK